MPGSILAPALWVHLFVAMGYLGIPKGFDRRIKWRFSKGLLIGNCALAVFGLIVIYLRGSAGFGSLQGTPILSVTTLLLLVVVAHFLLIHLPIALFFYGVNTETGALLSELQMHLYAMSFGHEAEDAKEKTAAFSINNEQFLRDYGIRDLCSYLTSSPTIRQDIVTFLVHRVDVLQEGMARQHPLGPFGDIRTAISSGGLGLLISILLASMSS